MKASSRSVAARVLQRVCSKGAFAAAALDGELSRAQLSDRDAALAAQIVYGSLRVLPALDRAIEAQLTRPGRGLDPLVQAALRSAAFQLAHLSGVPDYAVVDETVRLVRAERGQRVAGFVNAVVRKLAAGRVPQPQLPTGLVLPEWLQRRLQQSLGDERVHAALQARELPPPLGLRAERLSREELAARIVDARPEVELRPGELAPRCLLLRRSGDPRQLPGYERGDFAVQEEGSQLVALYAGARSGERVVELCAGHGGKTAELCRAVGPGGRLAAVDIDERKLERIAPELARLGLAALSASCPVTYHAVDLEVGAGDLEPGCDRVLLDAPCSGLGTIHRRPELALRVTEESIARLFDRQLALAKRAASLLRPGGTLVYAVCSPLRQEGPAVAAELETQLPDLERVSAPEAAGLPAPDGDGVIRLGPWLSAPGASSPDMYQVLIWRKRCV